MVRPKRHTTKEVTQKVASTYSPPTAPDVAKKPKSNMIPGLTRVNTMPLWWTTAQWRNQFPIDATMRSDITMNAIKKTHARDELLQYCPAWSAAAKKGRPKKDERRKTITDHIEVNPSAAGDQ